MPHHSPAEHDPEVLPDRVATRLLERASEMDVARMAGSTVADLRAAAAEAGISTHSFDAALAEMQRDANPVVAATPASARGRYWKWVFAALATTVFVAMIVVPRLVIPVPSTSEESILLRCLTPGEAAELIRPVLNEDGATIVVRSAQAPRAITIRATPAGMQKAKATLDMFESAKAPACAIPPAIPAKP
ncbi:MAG: hypothetical protein IPP90_07275 [Gemmatimonadaceae bacterium]|nr:hypothetical protein [Gemmatimonadaceae bacterium]